jgi:hypothetical protein
VFSAVDLYLWRSYSASEAVWVDDPGTFGQGISNALGFDPYSTAAQNFARLFSNLVGTQSFNDGIADKLVTQNMIHSDAERGTLISSLSLLTISPGRSSSSGSSSGSASGSSGTSTNGDHIISIQYVCKKEVFCPAVLLAALDVLRVQYSELKARSAATARAIYEANLKAGEADVAAATAAIQKYQASLPKAKAGSSQNQDPVLTSLQHDLDAAQKEVDTAKAELLTIDTVAQVSKGMANDLYVVDGPRVQKGLYGIKGASNDNVKSDAIAWASCLAVAAVYLILVAFLDRTVRDPAQLKKRLGKPVTSIPEYVSQQRQRPGRRAGLWPRGRDKAIASV